MFHASFIVIVTSKLQHGAGLGPAATIGQGQYLVGPAPHGEDGGLWLGKLRAGLGRKL